MNEIKPIETIYNGYRFRSRLEARWAVFFDAAGIKYEYEPDGYEYENEKYLPDFYLPNVGPNNSGVFVEVKPDDDTRLSEIWKAVNVICHTTGKTLLLLSSIPNITKCGIWMYHCFYYSPMEGDVLHRDAPLMVYAKEEDFAGGAVLHTDWAISRFTERKYCQWERIADGTMQGKRGYWSMPISGLDAMTYEGCGEQTSPSAIYANDTLDSFCFREPIYTIEEESHFEFAKQAYSKARKARFEHGECG